MVVDDGRVVVEVRVVAVVEVAVAVVEGQAVVEGVEVVVRAEQVAALVALAFWRCERRGREEDYANLERKDKLGHSYYQRNDVMNEDHLKM